MSTQKSLDLAKRLWKWEPHSQGQRDWMLCDAKVKTAACGRRWGKSESTAIDIVLYALENPHTIQFIIAPTDDQTKIMVDEVRKRLYAAPGLAECIVQKLSPYPLFKFRDGGALIEPTTITARTAGTDGKGLRGRKAHRVITDESAFIGDKIVDAVITPLLADYDGQLVNISTPAGRNHFWRSFTRGQDAAQTRYASFQFPSSTNPYLPKDYLENERLTKSERTYRIEYLAEFADEEGLVFRGVRDAVDTGRTENEPPKPGRFYTQGVDLARVEDFTVIDVVDDTGRQVYHERFNQISWDRQKAAITRVANEYKARVILDSTGVGDPIFEDLRRAGLNIHGFQFTNKAKESLIDNLAMMIEQSQVSLMDLPTQTNELLSYAYELTPSRNVRMNAPPGMHDDCVIALALSVQKVGGWAQDPGVLAWLKEH